MLVLMALEDMLADLGCTSVSVAGNIDRALHLIATNVFDLATLDVNLNGQRSYPVAKALRDHGIPFAFSTGYGGHGVGEGYGNCPVLDKPFNYRQLTKIMTALLTPSGNPQALVV